MGRWRGTLSMLALAAALPLGGVWAAPCPVGDPQGSPGAEAARRALVAAPARPGLRLAFAERLLRLGLSAAAEGCIADVLERHPDAMRARVLLARVALQQGQVERARGLLQHVVAHGPQVAAAEARALLDPLSSAPPSPSRWAGRVALGGYHDSRAAALDPTREGEAVDPEGPLPVDDDPAAWRLALTGEASWSRAGPDGALRARVGLDRTLHLADSPDPGRLDHTSLWIDAHRERRLGEHRLGFGGELRGTLSGRIGDPHHLGAGLVGWWRRTGASGGPWARIRVLGFAFGSAAERDEAAELWTEAAIGGEWRRDLFTVDGRLGAQWIGPGPRGYAGLAADLRPGLAGRLGALYLLVGIGWRRADAGDAMSPRVGAGAAWALGQQATLSLDGIWQQARRTDIDAERIDRIVVGTTLEVRL